MDETSAVRCALSRFDVRNSVVKQFVGIGFFLVIQRALFAISAIWLSFYASFFLARACSVHALEYCHPAFESSMSVMLLVSLTTCFAVIVPQRWRKLGVKTCMVFGILLGLGVAASI